MERLIALILGGGLRLPLLDPELLKLDREVSKSDLLALLMLQRRGEATMSDLAADLGAPLSTVTGIGARLTNRGLIQRERDPQDRRVLLVRLTPEGASLAGRARSLIDGLLGRITSVLTPEELQQVITLVEKVIHSLQSPQPTEQKAGESIGPRRIPIED